MNIYRLDIFRGGVIDVGLQEGMNYLKMRKLVKDSNNISGPNCPLEAAAPTDISSLNIPSFSNFIIE